MDLFFGRRMTHTSLARSFLLLILLFMVLGCQKDSETGNETSGGKAFYFSEASEGLPESGLWRQGIDFYDLNGDGVKDIVAPPPRNGGEDYTGPVAWYGSPDRNWKESKLKVPADGFYDYGDVAVSDMDGDGIPDIVLAVHAAGLTGLKGSKDGTYEAFSGGFPSSKVFASRAVVSADFTGDGVNDIAAISEGKFGKNSPDPSGIRICSMREGKWTCWRAGDETEPERAGLFADQMAVGDVNGDGKADVAVASLVLEKNLIVWINEGKGRFVPFNKGLPEKKIYFSVALKDLNGDGRDDLVANISGLGRENFVGVKAFLSTPDGFTDISEGLPVKEPYTMVDAADMDGNGTVEIIGGTVAGGIKIFCRKGERWVPVNVTGLPAEGMKQIYGLYCVDIDKDGHMDVAVNYASSQTDSGGIRVFLNSGAGQEK